MSKSLGNVIWAKDMIASIGGNVLRWLMLSTHYRSPLNINEDGIETARKELSKVMQPLKQAYVKLSLADDVIGEDYDEVLVAPFLAAMEDDLNTPNAFAALFEAVKVFNQTLRQREIDYAKLSKQCVSIEKMLDILGIESQRLVLSDEDKALHGKWRAAVKEKDFEQADMYRAKLIERGIL